MPRCDCDSRYSPRMEIGGEIDQQGIQNRTVRTLAVVQIFGGVGVAIGGAVSALIAAELASDSLSGLAATASVIGAALFAIPVSRLMNLRGRGPGLMLAYGIGILGALTVVAATKLEIFPLALLGMFGAGAGMTAGLQSRYAATDLSTENRRGRSLSMVVWATTIGSVLGPNLASPMGSIAERIDLPRLAGPYLMTVAAFLLSGLIISMFLKPDPLLTAREIEGSDRISGRTKTVSVRDSVDLISSVPAATLALLSMAVGQTVMVAVMSMTPVHLRHADAGLQIIGLVISGHIAGMYIASPLVGIASDRFGRRPIIILGCLILLTSFVISGTATGHESAQLGAGLFMLGLGWSCTMIAGATLLTESIPLESRPTVQGSADLIMGFFGASASLAAGAVMGLGSYTLLNIFTTLLVVPLMFMAVRSIRQPVDLGQQLSES